MIGETPAAQGDSNSPSSGSASPLLLSGIQGARETEDTMRLLLLLLLLLLSPPAVGQQPRLRVVPSSLTARLLPLQLLLLVLLLLLLLVLLLLLSLLLPLVLVSSVLLVLLLVLLEGVSGVSASLEKAELLSLQQASCGRDTSLPLLGLLVLL